LRGPKGRAAAAAPVGGKTSKGRAIDVLTPASMAPVSLELSESPRHDEPPAIARARCPLHDDGARRGGRRGAPRVHAAKHPPPASTPATTAAAAVAPPPPADVPTPPPAVTGRRDRRCRCRPADDTGGARAIASTITTSKAKKKTVAHVRAAAPTVVVLPKSTPSAGGDSLLDLIKKSVATGK